MNIKIKIYYTILFFFISNIIVFANNKNIKDNDKKIISKSFVIEKEKKNELQEITRSFKSTGIKKPNTKINVDYEKNYLEPEFNALNHKLRIFKAKEIEMSKLLQNYISLGFDSYTYRSNIYYHIGSRRNEKYYYFGAADIEIPISLIIPKNILGIVDLKYFTENHTMSSKVDYKRKTIFLSEKPILKSRTLNELDTSIGLNGNFNNTNYFLSTQYRHFNNKNPSIKQYFTENSFIASLGINHFLEKYRIKFNFDINTILIKPNILLKKTNIDSLLKKTIELKPYISYTPDFFKIKAGFITTIYNDISHRNNINFGPNIYINYSGNFFSPYIICKSLLIQNTYQNVIKDNPIWLATKRTKIFNTLIPCEITTGLNIDIFGSTLLDIGYSCKFFEKLLFYKKINNNFDIIFDNAVLHNPYLQFSFKNLSENFYSDFRFDYYLYTNMKTVKKPYHKPKYQLSWFAYYILHKKLTLNINSKFVGGIEYLHKRLKNIIDLDFGLTYKLTKRLIVDLDFENILFQTYTKYYGVVNKPFNFKLTFSFIW